MLRGGCSLLLFICFVCCFAARWYRITYSKTGFDAIIYTLTADLGGVDPALIGSFVNHLLDNKAAWIWMAACVAIVFTCNKKVVHQRSEKQQIQLYPFVPIVTLALSLAVSGGLLWRASELTSFADYVRNGMASSTLFEENYCDPGTVEITFPEKKRNLIYLYLESMENTFISEEKGGALPYNTIPELTQLAEENVCFSHNDLVGGFRVPNGTTWTVGGIVGQTAGIPLKVPFGVGINGYGGDGKFLPGVTMITDILHENGYVQAFVLGSAVDFGGQRQYFETHGMDAFFDHTTAQEDGIIEKGYDNGFWGMEDLYLFNYAKQTLTKLAEDERPFAVSVSTIDTHFADGYLCPLCEDTYEEQYDNVFRCSSAQIAAFLDWCKAQEWYENTTIVLVGDHLTMDGAYISRNVVDEYDRRVYNCIINSAAVPQREKFRDFSTFDMFPTTLAAMGCQIEGDKLGLGTNLFSNEPTLVEKMGWEAFNQEVSRFSEYYPEKFW